MLERLKKKAAAALPKVVKAAGTIGKEIKNKAIELTKQSVVKLTESPAQKLLRKTAASVPSQNKKGDNTSSKMLAAVPKTLEVVKKEAVREINDSKTQLKELTDTVTSILPGTSENKPELSEKNKRILEKYKEETQKYHEDVERGKTRYGALRYYTCTSLPIFKGLNYLFQLRKTVVEEYPILDWKVNNYNRSVENFNSSVNELGNQIYNSQIPIVSNFTGALVNSSDYRENGPLPLEGKALNQTLNITNFLLNGTSGMGILRNADPNETYKMYKDNTNVASVMGANVGGFVNAGAVMLNEVLSPDRYGTLEGIAEVMRDPEENLPAIYERVKGYVNYMATEASTQDKARLKGRILFEIASYVAIGELLKAAEGGKLLKSTEKMEVLTEKSGQPAGITEGGKTGVSINRTEVVSDGAGKAASSGGEAARGGAIEGTGKIADLSPKALKHPINDHMPTKYAQQLKYQSTEAVEAYLNKKSFFNPSWTEEQIKNALNLGYKDAISNGVTNGYHSYEIYGEMIQIYIREGKFSTGFGSYKLNYQDLLNLVE